MIKFERLVSFFLNKKLLSIQTKEENLYIEMIYIDIEMNRKI